MPDKANNNAGDCAPELPGRHGLLSNARRDCPRWRARPDGHQQWVRLPIDPASATRLRVRAVESGVTVDAWLGIAISYALVQRETLEVDLAAELQCALESAPLRFGSSERLCSWQRYLLSADGPGLGDELPEVVMGAGVSSSDAASVLQQALELKDSAWVLARECELRAAAGPTPLRDYIRDLIAVED